MCFYTVNLECQDDKTIHTTTTYNTQQREMQLLLTIVFTWICGSVIGHSTSNSALYKKYKASAAKKGTFSVPTYGVSSPSSADQAARDKSLFYPPLPGQSGVDYHPQLKTLAENDTQIVYYSWHAHVYFFHEDENVTQRTLALRDQFMKRFSLAVCDDSCFMGGPFDTCTQGKLCFYSSIYSNHLIISSHE